MTLQRILIVEDDLDIVELMRYNLSKEGYGIIPANSAEAALPLLRREAIDLILLDLMLPGIDGLELCREIKKDNTTANIPIVMVTAKGEESDIVAGLELGADDYIVKPFSPRVLVARLRAVIRRKSGSDKMLSDSPIHIHDLDIHPGRHEVAINHKPVALTFTEFRILQYLASCPGWVFTRGQIMDAVRGDNYPVTDRSIDVAIVGLRKKLESHSNLIETVRGIGYRFKEKDV